MNYLNMLTQLGIGSAHPGGYTSTLKLIDSISLKPGCSILEVGCGTGRTACLLAQKGYQVTAIDLHPEMIEKALHRNKFLQQNITFEVGDICAIPSASNQFDMVLAESVTNFADAQQAISEYYRVLKPGGTLYDREVIYLNPMAQDNVDDLQKFLGFAQLFSAEEWIAVLESQRFTDIRLTDVKLMDERAAIEEHNYPDQYQLVSEGAYSNVLLWQTSLQYTQLFDRNQGFLGSAVLTGEKPQDGVAFAP